jgi:hypothetical protein
VIRGILYVMAMQYEGPIAPIDSPEAELAHLRAQVEAKERELEGMRKSVSPETLVRERVVRHVKTPAEHVLHPSYQMPSEEAHELALNLDPESDDETMAELRSIMETRGIHNAFSVLEKLKSPHLEDDFHRFLVAYLLAGRQPKGLAESAPEWKSLHMTLYRIALPEAEGEDMKGRPFRELVASMEQFYGGMLAIEDAYHGEPPYFALELAVPVDSPELHFYAAVPNSRRDLFEKQILAVFPNAVIETLANDYNVFVQDGESEGSIAKLQNPHPLALKDYQDFEYDPLNALLNAFAKIAPEDEGAALQIIFKPHKDKYVGTYRRMLKELRKGTPKKRAFEISHEPLAEFIYDAKEAFRNGKDEPSHGPDQMAIESVEKKMAAPVVETNIRLVASSGGAGRASQILGELEAAFNQYENTKGNRIEWKRAKGGSAKRFYRNLSYRLFSHEAKMPLSLKELTALYHFPPRGIVTSPHLRQSRFTTAAAPLTLPKDGIVIGTNAFRGQTTEVRLSPPDRLRHLYTIGQTGAGKTGLLRTLIEQDIKNGEGVCFIDPHGNDVLEILATIPPERYEDVIYFDPAYLDRPFGLNMLEYDPAKPEQKTFIVNELFMIFRRLYGDVPESMGPAFEQYFRNATMLVMEDPSTGSTMLDIARVLSDSSFRNLKLSRSRNPIVNQFWEKIATQAGGEASLENIVPYITNKFDDFTANDFIRPIVGQQESSFRFREVIDRKKILLVNLSKGRLGERNANLLGLIIVGKLFMAALSRADDPRGDFPPFYLYIDEFQNITTDSIPGILSEARKYKLSLTMAHQFLKQIDDKTRDAVFGNVGSMIIFRVGEEDGEFFEKQFAPTFKALDFVNIENRNAYAKILANGVPQKPFNIRTLELGKGNWGQVDDLRELSYLTYGRDREAVEADIHAKYLS